MSGPTVAPVADRSECPDDLAEGFARIRPRTRHGRDEGLDGSRITDLPELPGPRGSTTQIRDCQDTGMLKSGFLTPTAHRDH